MPLSWPSMRSIARCVLPVFVGPSTAVTLRMRASRSLTMSCLTPDQALALQSGAVRSRIYSAHSGRYRDAAAAGPAWSLPQRNLRVVCGGDVDALRVHDRRPNRRRYFDAIRYIDAGARDCPQRNFYMVVVDPWMHEIVGLVSCDRNVFDAADDEFGRLPRGLLILDRLAAFERQLEIETGFAVEDGNCSIAGL